MESHVNVDIILLCGRRYEQKETENGDVVEQRLHNPGIDGGSASSHQHHLFDRYSTTTLRAHLILDLIGIGTKGIRRVRVDRVLNSITF